MGATGNRHVRSPGPGGSAATKSRLQHGGEREGGVMSRSGYTDDCEGADLVMWRGQVASAMRGKRGQAFFRDLVAALDAMPAKRLVANEFESDGEVCALGSLARRKGVDFGGFSRAVSNEDYSPLAGAFNIAEQLAQETMFINDEAGPYRGETDEQRWNRVRAWAARQIRVTPDELLPEPASPVMPAEEET